ncbi:F-box domain, Leucine-rich repeat domain, L domain-like protein [Artemisia annua]|uniref:F-box domain, Leucine-rich repeat domain, L domain-like protein n=1 Tax=Artemisia annua TaxID=35608 RepID=A0A2U1KP27_ARTAN|nr:F-box domain, Leucine-rich repeat domain, L domain-like protein [Artemisia annua]
MESGRRKMRINVQGDRLSNLPDDLIHKILSLVGIKLAVQTSALSPRWRYLWTSLPCLNFSSEDFRTLTKFSRCVTKVLSCRNNQIGISSATLSFSFRKKASQESVKRILNYTFSHNVKQLTVSFLPDKSAIEFPLSLFSSQSLEHLTIAGYRSASSVILTSTWGLTSLTTLHIESVTFNYEVTGIFSKCANLKKLVLKYCSMRGSNGVDICHPGLSNLTLENGLFENVINVVAPQLKNLTVRYWQGLHLISAPELVSLRFKDLCIIKECYYKPNKPDTHTIFDLLQQLHSVKYLTLNMEIFQLLSPLISYQPSPFVNLKSLKVYPYNYWVEVPETIPAEVKKYLLDGSPSATFTEVSCEEMRALENVKSALKCMVEFREMLEHEKANIETNIVHMHEQDKLKINKREMMDQIDSCWKDLSAQIEHGKSKTSGIISKLCHIEQLLKELPASKRAQIEKLFSRLCMEADTVMNNIIDCVKIQSEEKQSRLSIYCHDLAMAAKPSFS